MGIGGAASHVGISKVRCTIVQSMPACHKHFACVGTCSFDTIGGFKTHSVGERRHWRALRTESEMFRISYAPAIRSDIDIILRIGIQISNHIGQIAHHLVGAGTQLEAVDTVFHIPGCGRTDFGPTDGCCICGNTGTNYVLHIGAVGYLFDCDIVHIGIPYRSGALGSYSNVGTIAGEVVKINGEFSPCCAAAGIDINRAHLLECIHIVRVGHHTHLKHRVIAGGAGFGPKSDTHRIHGNIVGVDTRQYYIIVVAIRSCSSSTIPVKSLCTAWCMVVGAAAGDIGIAHI